MLAKISFLCLYGLAIAYAAEEENPKICKSLHENLKSNRMSDVMVSMRGGTNGFLNEIDFTKSFKERGDRATKVANALRTNSARSQGPLTSVLNNNNVKYESFWINNEVHVPFASPAMVRMIANVQNVQGVRLNDVVPLLDPIREVKQEGDRTCDKEGKGNSTCEAYGVRKIEAYEAWQITQGEGAIVGVIDTGARATHESLRNNFVGLENYGWYDPFTNSSEIVDKNGHGTHCTGTVLGTTDNIGVAPSAKWMACRGCGASSCSGAALSACSQFMLCPHDTSGNNPDCSKHPDVVSNSWGGVALPTNTWFDSIAKNWIAAEIVPVFAMGNSGPFCHTGGYPGVNTDVIAVGSTNNDDSISRFSSKGPHYFSFKPDISAPGSDIYSASHQADTEYKKLSGTSMACPHVAGVVALLRSANKDLTVTQIKKILYTTTETKNLRRTGFWLCGFRSELADPNNTFGHGRVNANAAVKMAFECRSDPTKCN